MSEAVPTGPEGSLKSPRDDRDIPHNHYRGGQGRDYNSNGRYTNNRHNYNQREGSSNNYNQNNYYNGGRHGGRGYRDNRPPAGEPGYDRALQAQRPRFGSTLGGRGRGRGPRLPNNVKERTSQVFVSEQVMLSKEIITRLGDFRNDPNDPLQMLSDMREMAEVLVSTNDLKEFRDDMSELFTKCMSQLPVQGPLIATLLSLISKTNNVFPTFLVNKMASNMNVHIGKGEILHAKLLLRCLAVMASCGAVALKGDDGFEGLVKALVASAEPKRIDAAGSFSLAQQAATYLLAAATPYMAPLLAHSCGDLAKRCRTVFQRVLSEWKSPFDTNGKNAIFNVNTIMLDDATEGPEDMACWDTLWEGCHLAVKLLDGEAAASDPVGVTVSDGLHVHSSSYAYPNCFLRPWTQITEDMSRPFELAKVMTEEPAPSADGTEALSVAATADDAAAVLDEGLLRFNVADISVLLETLSSPDIEATLRVGCAASAAASGRGVFSWLCARFPIFDAETGPNAATCVSLSFFEKYFMSDTFRDIFFFFQPYIRDDGTHIGTVDQVAVHQMAAFKLFPEDTAVHLEYILIETMLLLIVQVPAACAGGVYRLILELCKKNSKVPPAVASVTGVLAQLFPAMDTSSWRSITRWLSSHLTNSKLAWPFWDYWAGEYAESAEDSVHKAFMALLVEQCSRAMPAQKLRTALPDGIHDAVIEEFSPVVDPLFADGAEGALAAVARLLLQKVDSRDDADDLQEWLEEAHDGVDDALESESWRTVLLMKAVLIAGSRKTLSHLVSMIDKYRDALRELGESDAGQKAIMDACVSVMGHDMGFGAVLLDVMIRRGVLKAATLATFVCGDDVIVRLANDTHVYAIAEIAADRSLDVAQALIATRKTLIGRGLLMESDAEIGAGPKDYSGAVTHVMSMGGGPSTPGEKEKPTGDQDEADVTGGKRPRDEAEAEEDDNGDDEDARSRRRRKFDEDEKDGVTEATVPSVESEGPGAQLAVVDATLDSALRDCRAIYSKVLVTLMLRLNRRQKELSAASSGEDDMGVLLDPWCMAALSLLRSVLRSFQSAQDSLISAGDGEHKVCDTDSVQFEISDLELSAQLRAVWQGFTGYGQ